MIEIIYDIDEKKRTVCEFIPFKDKLILRYQQFALLFFAGQYIRVILSEWSQIITRRQNEELEWTDSFESGAVQSTLDFLWDKNFRQQHKRNGKEKKKENFSSRRKASDRY